jgi:hypothetical protein
LTVREKAVEGMFDSSPCRICNEAGHSASRCRELVSNKPSPAQRGSHDDDDESLNLPFNIVIITLEI